MITIIFSLRDCHKKVKEFTRKAKLYAKMPMINKYYLNYENITLKKSDRQ